MKYFLRATALPCTYWYYKVLQAFFNKKKSLNDNMILMLNFIFMLFILIYGFIYFVRLLNYIKYSFNIPSVIYHAFNHKWHI